ncbi:MAG: PEP-CTERM sorting domain-containing protein [Planctomycetota bacterium]
MLKSVVFGCVALFGLSGVASAATISAVLKAGYPNDLTGKIERTVDGDTTVYNEGPIGIWNQTPNQLVTVVNVNKALDGGIALVRTDVNLNLNGPEVTYKLTTYAAMYTPGGNPISVPSGSGTSTSTSAVSFLVNNKAYWEFDLVGNYDWRIRDTDPLADTPTNRRTYDFVKVVNGNNVSIYANSVGTGAFNKAGEAEIGSGRYRLYFRHFDSGLLRLNTDDVNSVDLDITFTLKSEDNNSVVPEPSSVAVFGLLGVGSAIAKWRRKKLQAVS